MNGTASGSILPPNYGETVIEEYEYDERGRVTRKTVRRTTPLPPSPYQPYTPYKPIYPSPSWWQQPISQITCDGRQKYQIYNYC